MIGIRDYNICLISSGTEKKKTREFYRKIISPSFPNGVEVNCDYIWIKNSNLDIIKEYVEKSDLIVFLADEMDSLLFFALGIAFSSDKSTLLIHSATLEIGTWISSYSKIKMVESEDLYSVEGIDADDVDVIKKYLNGCCREKNSYISMFNKLWFRQDVKVIHVIVAAEVEKPTDANIESPNYGFMDNVSDKDAIYQVVKLLSARYPYAELPIEIAADFDTKQMSDNMVIIGGPGGAEYEMIPGTVVDDEGNRICRRISDMMESNIAYTSDCEQMLVDGKSYRAEYNGKLMSSDYGYFAAINNPYNPQNRIILIHGIHTLGVAGAAQVFSKGQIVEDNFEIIAKVLEEKNADEISFESFFQIDVIKGVAMIPRISKDNIFLVRKKGTGTINVVRNMILPEVSENIVLGLKKRIYNLLQEVENLMPEVSDNFPDKIGKLTEGIERIKEILHILDSSTISKDDYNKYKDEIEIFERRWDGTLGE